MNKISTPRTRRRPGGGPLWALLWGEDICVEAGRRKSPRETQWCVRAKTPMFGGRPSQNGGGPALVRLARLNQHTRTESRGRPVAGRQPEGDRPGEGQGGGVRPGPVGGQEDAGRPPQACVEELPPGFPLEPARKTT